MVFELLEDLNVLRPDHVDFHWFFIKSQVTGSCMINTMLWSLRGENRSAQMKRNNVFGRRIADRIADSKQIGEPKWAGQSWWFRMSEWPARSTSKCSTPKRSTMCQMIFDLKVWMICKWAFETLWSRLHSFTIWRPLNFLHKIHLFEMEIGNKSQKFKLLYSMGTNNDSHAVQAVLGRFTAWAALKSSRIW